MTGLDWVAVAILTLSALAGLKRGLIQEALALAAWVLAFFLASRAAPILGPHLPGMTEGRLRDGVAMVLVFIAVLILASLAKAALRSLARAAGLSLEDRLLGFFFGLARGALTLVALTLVAGLTALPQTEAWKASRLHGPLQDLALAFKPLLPDDLATKIRFV